jgi:beta-N-acetylhexosaminidase
VALPSLTRPRSDRGEGLTRRPWTIALLCLLAAAAIATPVALLDLHPRRDLPDSPPTGGRPRVTILDALARVTTPPPPLARSVAALPLERRVAQLFMVGFSGTGPDAKVLRTLPTRDWGGVILQATNFSSDEGVRALVATLQEQARRARDQPLLVAAAQEGGDRRALPDLPPAPQPELARGGVRAVRREAGRAAVALRRLGIRMTLAPLADVAAEGGPFVPRAFGLDAGFVARAVAAAVRAYLRAGVIPAVGAFPGEGGAAQDPAAGPAPVGLDLPSLERRDLRPFRAIAGRAPVIVMANATYAAFDGVTPASLLPEAVRLLRTRLGFRGVVMTGDLVATTATTATRVPKVAVDALEAGADLLYVPGSAADQQAAYRAVLRAVRSGAISRARLDASVVRILALKQRFGIARRGR